MACVRLEERGRASSVIFDFTGLKVVLFLLIVSTDFFFIFLKVHVERDIPEYA